MALLSHDSLILCYFLCFYYDVDYDLHTQYIICTDVLLFADAASCSQVDRETDLIHRLLVQGLHRGAPFDPELQLLV